MEGKKLFIKADCFGKYKGNGKNIESEITDITIFNIEKLGYYNKAILEEECDSCLTPHFLNGAKVDNSEHDLYNVIIDTTESKVHNRGDYVEFEGYLYATIYADESELLAKKSRSSPGATDSDKTQKGPLSDVKGEKGKNLSGQDGSQKNQERGIARRNNFNGCYDLLWKLLLFILLILLILFLIEEGCNDNPSIFSNSGCPDTVYIKDTIYIDGYSQNEKDIEPNRSPGEKPLNIRVQEENVQLFLYDCQEYDHDFVDIYLNGKNIVSNFKLPPSKDNPFIVSLMKGTNKLKIVTKDQGEDGPCTIGIQVVSEEGNVYMKRCENTFVNKPFNLNVLR